MMPDQPYQVVRVPARLDTPESKGTRTKFWVTLSDQEVRWLLKIPRPNTGEHWAEKIAAEVGRLIGVDCAQVELARCVEQAVFAVSSDQPQEQPPTQPTEGDLLATICKSFFPDEYVDDTDYHFLQGWEVLQFAVEDYDSGRRFGQRDHNVKNITVALAQLMGLQGMNPGMNPMPRWDYALEALASYALLDGLIGNTDRHHENWMVACVYAHGDMMVEIMPSFDHASSLGRELTDDKRHRILESDAVLRYVYRGRGGVYVDTGRKRAPSPLHLARLLCRWRPTFTRRTLDRIQSVSEHEIRTAIQRVPDEFMSDLAKEFACRVVMTGRQELLRSAR